LLDNEVGFLLIALKQNFSSIPQERKRMDAKKKLKIDWTIKQPVKPSLDRFRRYMRDLGLRPSSIDSYMECIRRFLDSGKTVPEFLDGLHNRKLAGSTIDNYISCIKKYHAMIGEPIELHYLKRAEGIPYYFDEEEVIKLFGVVHNLKHLTMLNLLFYTGLRASELCSLDDGDLDLKDLSLRIRDGKGGRAAIAFLSNDCGALMKNYLGARPPLIVDGRQPLFYTDFGKRWDRKDLYRMFILYKKKANIQKKGGLHVFARHTPATIMIAKGCDVRIVKELLRHRDIRTTMRYAHVSDKTVRNACEQYLKL
jgi:integrase/recombinase XerD